MYDIITNNARCFARKKPDYSDKYYKRVQKLSTDSWENQETTAACCANYFFCTVLMHLCFLYQVCNSLSPSLCILVIWIYHKVNWILNVCQAHVEPISQQTIDSILYFYFFFCLMAQRHKVNKAFTFSSSF